ncbi:MAG TPA: hypothetical protein CFH80_03810 [Sulfurospirillum cavolei]|uniref:DUF5723 domain-containing protein n=1 Tax=Sulfurospirillum cavolei TaxID=366522 RepID=A0A2D3W9Q5_9BACT|nr:MAG TPA: hypothetical protein CFH80_03810 [Sulfurospirillum cavolei]
MSHSRLTFMLSSFFLVSTVTAFASDTSDDSLFSLYQLNSRKSDSNSGNTSNGGGVYYDTEMIKVRLENTSDYLKVGTVFKYNPEDTPWYIKTGLSYLNEKIYGYDGSSDRVNQYGLTLGIGYKLTDTLYAEIGANRTDLHGTKIGSLFEVTDETTKRAYAELVKRLKGDFGVLDASVNIGRTYYEFADDENFVGFGMSYYPTSSSKISIFHNAEVRNHATSVTLSYEAFELAYRNLSDNAHRLMVGFKLQCTNIFDVSSCKIPTNIIPDISENDKFEQITFSSAAEIQTSKPNPIAFQCIKPTLDFNYNNLGLDASFDTVLGGSPMLGSLPVDENGCLIHNSDRLNYNYVYEGSDMFFGQTGNPQTVSMFQSMDWYGN